MESQEKTSKNKKSALLIIGNEILSGRTQDKNINTIAVKMGDHGVPLSEVRIVPDIEEKIVDAVNALRAEYDFVFTTGGIGPTHDDITSECMAKAFGVGFGQHEKAIGILREYYGEADLTPARATMADMPIHDDMDLILNPVSAAPGFRIGNVFVMAGVPKIMAAMFDHVVRMITPGAAMLSRTIMVAVPESQIAEILSTLQDAHPEVDIGSYPQFKDGHWGVSAVLRGTDAAVLDKVQAELVVLFSEKGIESRIIGDGH